jgi:magnesium transporter
VTERTEIETQATRLEELLKRGDSYELQELVEKVHPSDLADILEELDEEQRLRLIGLLPASTAGETLAEMDEVEHPEELLARLKPERIAEVVEEMPDDDAADLIGRRHRPGSWRPSRIRARSRSSCTIPRTAPAGS